MIVVARVSGSYHRAGGAGSGLVYGFISVFTFCSLYTHGPWKYVKFLAKPIALLLTI